jgi:hypothetical protein
MLLGTDGRMKGLQGTCSRLDRTGEEQLRDPMVDGC